MGSLGLPATAMAVRSAFALLCFALLCGLAASSVGQSETETELTKREGEAAGNNLLVEQALESRDVRGARAKNEDPCRHLNGKKKRKCKKVKRRREGRKGRTGGRKKCPKGKKLNNKNNCVPNSRRSRKQTGKKCKNGRERDVTG